MLSEEFLRRCTLCPRACGVDRLAGQCGYCGAAADVTAARAALHLWEEPCLVGANGAGTVFFTGCSMGCVFCQNNRISRKTEGERLTPARLAEIFLDLQARGAANIDLVTPTHYVVPIAEALIRAKAGGLSIPVVYNCGGYESVAVLQELEGLIDIYMPDFKFWKTETAAQLAHAPNYPEIARNAIREMFRQRGPARFYDDGTMKRGVLVRHLVLPGHTKEAIAILTWLAEEFRDGIFISLMDQYTPIPGIPEEFGLSRKVTRREYDKVVNAAIDLKLTNVFLQERDAADGKYIPRFDGTGIRQAAGHPQEVSI